MPARRLAFLCDASGLVTAVLRDDLDMTEGALGRPLAMLFSRLSSAKCFALLEELNRESIVFGWDLCVDAADGEIISLHVAGARHADQILLLGSDDWQDVSRFNDELIRINNEHVNVLRRMIKERTARRPGPDADLLDRLAEVDNELMTLYRRVARQNADLARLSAERSLLVGMTAHDLRVPLTVVQGSVSDLLESSVLAARDRDALEEIDGACRTLERLARDVMDWSAAEAAELRLEREAMDLDGVVSDCVQSLRPVAARQRVRLEYAREQTVPLVEVDPVRIGQILGNLLANAIRFSREGDVVGVRLARGDHSVVVSVADRGPGIPPDELEAIFEPHRRGSERLARGEGWGLGLAMARRLAEAHGGSLDVENRSGAGARFRLQLPAAGEAA